ncbi:hypothetical protein EIP91_006169 [Steccherinum ochraceum]|uniref:Uncharacterized protein n=1 Tax=Steccherinum ochraceum TaxID=92696 RepID=A0A4V2MVL1_9APHY|nr:hypothetical protein EIP91_006169 [Steccherinum ochraceum]
MNLAVRTMGIWALERKVVILLTVGIAGLWCCVILNSALLDSYVFLTQVTLTYSAVFDGVIFLLMLGKLLHDNKGIEFTHLASHLSRDGAGYLLCSLTINILSLKANIFRDTEIGLFVASILTAIVSCRLVRRLSNYGASSPGGPGVYIMSQRTLVFRPVQDSGFDSD